MKLYRADLHSGEDGLGVWFKEFTVKRETPCYYFCSQERLGLKEKKIHKTSSRFAFISKELALNNLKYRKRLQIKHMDREIIFAQAFLGADIKLLNFQHTIIEGTRDLVHEFLVFD